MSQVTVKAEEFQRLRHSEARLRTILNAQPECVKTVDADGALLDMNPAGLGMIEVDTLDEVLGASVYDLITPDFHALYREGVRRVFDGEIVKQRYEIMGLRGTRRWVEQIATPLFDPNNPDRIIEMLAVTRDITAQKSMTEALIEAKQAAESSNLAKSQFIANMSHEIRTPLNGVLGMSQLLERTPLDDRQKKYTKTIRSSGSALLSLINDVLDISKIESGLMVLEQTGIDLGEVLEQTVDTVTGTAEQKGLKLSFDLPTDVPQSIIGDGKRIKQVLINLVGNAVKFTEQGSVKLSVLPQGEHALKFIVADTGPGICKEEQLKIFERFYQADGSLTRKEGGTGLGLSISSDLVKLMGGQIGVQSTEGEGTSFWFTLPLGESQQDLPPENGDLWQSSGNAESSVDECKDSESTFRILIAEDDKNSQEMLAETLAELEGIEFDFATDGHEVIACLDDGRFDLVLMDINMPVMTGDRAIDHIRSSASPYRNIPIIVVTANAMAGQKEHYLACGASAYLAKPVNIDRVLTLIEEFKALGAAAKAA